MVTDKGVVGDSDEGPLSGHLSYICGFWVMRTIYVFKNKKSN